MVFTAGLISGLGTILIYLGDAKAASEIEQDSKAGGNRSNHERERLGFTSQEVCAELCRRWHFSEELIDTIAKSGEPLSNEEISLAANAVFVARYICESRRLEISEEDKLAAFPSKEWQQLGLKEQDIATKLTEILALESGLDGLVD